MRAVEDEIARRWDRGVEAGINIARGGAWDRAVVGDDVQTARGGALLV